MKQICTGHLANEVCPTAPISAAIAVMDFVQWHDLNPIDLLIMSFVLRRLSSSLPAGTPAPGHLRCAGEALERAGTGWHVALGLPAHTAPRPIELDSAGPIVELPRCSCHEDADSRTTALLALLDNAATAVGRLVLSHCAAMCFEGASRGDAVTRDLIHAGAALTTAAKSLRSLRAAYCWN